MRKPLALLASVFSLLMILTPAYAATADPLASYVSQARGQGMTDDQVRSVLKAQGWPDDKINAAMGG